MSGARVLVTDAHERAVVATCRGLRRGGWAVSAAGAYRPSAAHWSRAVDRRYRIPDARVVPEDFVDRLEEILLRDPHDVLVPGAEGSLLQISEHRKRLEPLVRIGLPPHDVVLRALDKIAVLEVAHAVGLGPPESVTCNDESEALAAAERLGYPVLLKPARSLLPAEGTMHQRTSVTVEGPAALRRALLPLGAPVIVQRRESGPVISLGGVAAGGLLLGLCASRYRRTWPPTGGSASLTETIEPSDGLVERLEELLSALGWEGLFELEGLELAGGRFASIDFNPRPYGSMILAVASGANLPALWCEHLLQRNPDARRSRPGVHYRWEEAELRNLLWRLGRGRLREAASVLRPYRGTAHAFFEAADPAPLLARPARLVMRRVEAVRGRTGPLSV